MESDFQTSRRAQRQQLFNKSYLNCGTYAHRQPSPTIIQHRTSFSNSLKQSNISNSCLSFTIYQFFLTLASSYMYMYMYEYSNNRLHTQLCIIQFSTHADMNCCYPCQNSTYQHMTISTSAIQASAINIISNV